MKFLVQYRLWFALALLLATIEFLHSLAQLLHSLETIEGVGFVSSFWNAVVPALTANGIQALPVDTWAKAFADVIFLDTTFVAKQTHGNGVNANHVGCMLVRPLTFREWFLNLLDAKTCIEILREEYNTIRPHSTLLYKSSIEIYDSEDFASVQATTVPQRSLAITDNQYQC